MKALLSVILIVLSVADPSAMAAGMRSVYTDLSGKECNTIREDKETGSSTKRCPGVAGFSLLVEDDDARMSLTVVTPDNRQHPLNYWNIVTRSFSSLGKKAEWRVVDDEGKLKPIGLIVRVDASEQDDPQTPKKKSYLAVAKISAAEICVTAKIGPVKNANEDARQAADHAHAEACLKQ